MTEALQKVLEIRKVRKRERIFPYTLQYVGRQWRRIRKEAKLDGVRIHDLRRTFGSRAGRATQIDPYAVQGLMGHRDFRITRK